MTNIIIQAPQTGDMIWIALDYERVRPESELREFIGCWLADDRPAGHVQPTRKACTSHTRLRSHALQVERVRGTLLYIRAIAFSSRAVVKSDYLKGGYAGVAVAPNEEKSALF